MGRLTALSLALFSGSSQAACLAHYVAAYDRDPIRAAYTAYVLKDAARNHGLPLGLLAAVAQTESSFRVDARNGPSIGLMQVIPRWHRARIAGRNIWNPQVNVDVGASFLKELLTRYPNQTNALIKYNGNAIGLRYAEIVRKNRRALRSVCPAIS